MNQFDISSVDKRAKVKSILDMNSAAKSIYKFYLCIDGVIIPANPESIIRPELFNKSIMVFKGYTNYPWLNDACIDPVELTHIFKTLPMSIYEDDNGDRYAINVSKKVKKATRFGTKLTQEHIKDSGNFATLKLMKEFNTGNYKTEWDMDEETKQRLIDKETMVLQIGPNVSTIMNRELIPALKWSNDVRIYTRPNNYTVSDNIHEMVIVTHGADWEIFSFHIIINIETL